MPNHFERGKYRNEGEGIAPFLDALDNCYDILLALPDRESAIFFTVEEHQRAADTGDIHIASRHLLSDTCNWLKLFYFTTAFKTRQLTEALIDCYNQERLLSWLILGRSSLEYAAVTYYYAKKIDQQKLQGPRFAASYLMEMQDVLSRFGEGTRFNWSDLMAGNRDGLLTKFKPPEASSAVSVLTALEHLAKRDQRYKDVMIAYDMLCDFAHPNMGSHSAVLEMQTVPSGRHENYMAVRPGPLRGEFTMVMTLPWVSIGIGTSVELLIELGRLLHLWLNYLENDVPLRIDFAK